MKASELGSGLGLSGPLNGPLKCLMSAQYDPGLTLVVEMQELDILLLMTGHIAAGLSDTMQRVLRTVKGALNIGLQSAEKNSPLQAGVAGKGFVENTT